MRYVTEDKALSTRKNKEQTDSSERREKQDRRSMESAIDFPFKAKSGLIVMKDRRIRPDRRLNNIAVDNEEIDEQQFEETYQKFIGKN